MSDDKTAIPTTGCNVLVAHDQINNYQGNNRRTYIYNGGRWYLQSTSTMSAQPSGYNCINIEDINSVAVYEPFYAAIVVMLVAIFAVLIWRILRVFSSY